MIKTWFRNEAVADRSLVRIVLAAGALAMTLTAIYWPTFRELEERWRNDPSWSHGYAVVPACLWLMWSIAQRAGLPWRSEVSVSDTLAGSFAVLVGIGLHGVSNLSFTRPLSLDAVSFVVTLLGLLWIFGGRVGARTFGGAVLFLVFMVPLPFTWQQPLAEHLQHLVSITSETLLSLFGVPVHREGYLLRLPGQTVEVAEGCSGLRQITLFLAMSVFWGLVNRRRCVWLPLLMLSIPVAVFANTLRITMTGLIVAYAGSEWASGVLHEVEGLFTFALGLGMLWFAAGQLRQRFDDAEIHTQPSRPVTRSVSEGIEEHGGDDSVHSLTLRVSLGTASTTTGVLLRSRIAGLLVLLSCGVAVDAAEQSWISELGTVPTIRLARPLAEFPQELGEWVGIDTPVARREFLYGEEHLHRVYRHRVSGQTLTLWMVYTDDGRDRGHHPEVCMRAIGHAEAREQRQSVAVPGAGAPVERFFFRRPNGQSGQWVYHWYYVFRDAFDVQTSPSLWQQMQRNLRFQRSGLSVEVFAPKLSDADRDAADELVRRVAEHLEQHVPPTADRRTVRGEYLIVGGGRVVKD